MQKLRFIFAGGGTGGHLFPAIAIADEIKKKYHNADILFLGTKEKLEARVVPQHGYKFQMIWISGFQRRAWAKNILFPLKVIVSIVQAMSIIKKFDPAVVVGTGGYVSGPVLFAAALMKRPTLIHEQNSYPGATTRFLGKRVNEVHVMFEQSKKYFSRTDNIFVSGNPTRGSLEHVNLQEAYRYFGFNPNEKRTTVLVFGGSLGARTINHAVVKHLSQWMKDGIRIIWQTGKEEFENLKSERGAIPTSLLWVNAFIDRMDYAYAVADVVICRAGATTIAELTRLGKPAILIPYPFAAANHQVENARVLSDADAAQMLYDHDAVNQLGNMLHALLQDESKLRSMSERSKSFGKSDAARTIAESILKLSGIYTVAKG